MLQAIRDRAKGVVAWVIIIIIIIPFALWGVNEYLDVGGEVYVAEVNGEEIPAQVFRYEFQNYRMRLREMFGGRIDSSILEGDQLRRQFLDTMISEELLRQVAEKEGYRISNAHLARIIHAEGAFQTDGRFDPERYESLLRQQGMMPLQFEQRMRQQLIMQQSRQGIEQSTWISEHDLNQVARLQQQERDVSYLLLPQYKQVDSVEITEEQIKQSYEESRMAYMTPERVKLAYLELSVPRLAAQVEINEDAVRALFDETIDNYQVAEQRQASHILLTLSEDADEATVEQVQNQANELLEQLKAGASFADLAKEYSKDPGSALNGGNLGKIRRGMMVEPFEKAVFELTEGALSEPVRTQFGIHLIQLHKIEEARGQSFEEVKTKVEREYRQREAEAKLYEMSEQLANLTYEHPDNLEMAAQELGIPVLKSDWLIQGGDNLGIGRHQKVVNAAFSEDVLKAGNNSELLELETNHVAVIRVDTHEPARQQALDEVEASIREKLTNEQASKLVRELGEALLKRLREGEAMADIAKEQDEPLEELGMVKRNSMIADHQIIRSAFRLQRSQEGKTQYGGVALSDGDYALIAVSTVNDGRYQDMDEQAKDQLKAELNSIYGRNQYEQYLSDLREKADIKIFEKNL